MKRNFLFIVLSSLAMTSYAFAAKTQTIGIKDSTFNPVQWRATMANGGFSLQNQTNKIQYVQVNIERGEIYVMNISGGEAGSCRKSLDAEKGPFSIVCELAPNDRLDGDLDFARGAESSGTYQVEMEK